MEEAARRLGIHESAIHQDFGGGRSDAQRRGEARNTFGVRVWQDPAAQHRSVLREISAERLVFVEVVIAEAGDDLFIEGQVFLIPVRLKLVDVKPLVVIESQLDRAGYADIGSQVTQAGAVFTL